MGVAAGTTAGPDEGLEVEAAAASNSGTPGAGPWPGWWGTRVPGQACRRDVGRGPLDVEAAFAAGSPGLQAAHGAARTGEEAYHLH